MQHELEDFLRQVEVELSREYERIMRRATEDPGTAGDEGEENWAALLRKWLPSSYQVVTKGRLLGIDGEASPQMDVVVLKPSYPPALRDKKVYLAGGVAAAFECKTTLKKSHIIEATETAAKVQAIARPGPSKNTRQGTPYHELHGPIVYGLLAHSHSWVTGTAAGHVTEALNEALTVQQHPRDVLDITCVADLSTWTAMRMSYFGPRLNMWDQHPLRSTFPDGFASCAVMGPADPESFGSVEDQFPDLPVAKLCAYLTSRLAWEDPSMRPMADYFRLVGMHGRGRGMSQAWALEAVYSAGVVADLRRGGVNDTPWDPWQMVFL